MLKQSPNAYFSLAELLVHPFADGRPVGLYVEGRLLDGRFHPDGDVLGTGDLGQAGAPGWVELGDGTFHGAQTGRPPFAPYVEGYLGVDRIFRPSSRHVCY